MIVGLLSKKWKARLEASIAAMPGMESVAFESTTALVRAVRVRPVDAVVVDMAEDRHALQSMLAFRGGETGIRIAILAIAEDDGRLDPAQLVQPGIADFLCAPLRPDELQLRLGRLSALHRIECDRSRLTVGAYDWDLLEGTVYLQGEPVDLTRREFALGWLMFSNAGFFVGSAQIIRTVWNDTPDVPERTLQSYFYRLRKKLRLTTQAQVTVRTVYSLGYRVDVRHIAM